MTGVERVRGDMTRKDKPFCILQQQSLVGRASYTLYKDTDKYPQRLDHVAQI